MCGKQHEWLLHTLLGTHPNQMPLWLTLPWYVVVPNDPTEALHWEQSLDENRRVFRDMSFSLSQLFCRGNYSSNTKDLALTYSSLTGNPGKKLDGSSW